MYNSEPVGKLISFFLDDDSGCFYSENPTPPSEELRELLFKDHPPTSYITLIVNGKPYHMSDIGKLSFLKPERIGDYAISYNLKINSIAFSIIYLITNLESQSNNSVICLVKATNEGKSRANVGAKFLFDTVYGENNKKPALYLSDKEKIEYDRLFNSENLPDFVFSGYYDQDLPFFGIGLFIYPYLNEQKPEKLIIGNWKKLNENDLWYQIDPQAHFKYYVYSNPDAAVAVYFNNIRIDEGEGSVFGTVLSVNKVSPIFLNSNQVSMEIKNVFASNSNTASLYPVIPASPENVSLKNEIDLLEKLNAVIDKLNILVSNGLVPVNGIQEKSGLEKGLEKSAPESAYPYGDPFQNSNEIVIPQINNNIYNITNNINTVKTNTVDTEELNRLKTDAGRLEQQYNDKIAKLKSFYEDLIRKQQNEFKEISGAYKQHTEKVENRKDKAKKIGDVNETITRIDKKIAVIEELLNLNLDFETMPVEKMNEIELKIKDIEKKLGND